MLEVHQGWKSDFYSPEVHGTFNIILFSRPFVQPDGRREAYFKPINAKIVLVIFAWVVRTNGRHKDKRLKVFTSTNYCDASNQSTTMNFGVWGDVTDKITDAKFYFSRFRGLEVLTLRKCVIFGPGGRVPKSHSICCCCCCCCYQFSKGSKIPKAFLVRSGEQRNFAYTFVLSLPTSDPPSQIFTYFLINE